MAKKIKIQVNHKDVNVKPGQTVLNALKSIGIDVPTLCHDERIKPYGSCWVCVVEVEGMRDPLIASCSTQVREGMIIHTDSPLVRQTRKMALELLLSDHVGDCYAPCTVEGCPAQIDIQGFLALEARGEFIEAAKLIREKAPFPNALGRVCPRPCETVCRRGRVDDPIAIGIQKRYISEKEIEAGGPFIEASPISHSQRIAVIGGGPAGLSAAYYCRQKGYDVTIYEEQEHLGGMLRYGIPAYRLPNTVVETECNAIAGMDGIHVKQGMKVGRDIKFDILMNEYDAICLAIGAWNAYSMRVEGESLPGVISAIDYLYQISEGQSPKTGDEICVIGGGHTAMDAARSSIRLGKRVQVLYRRSADEMPAKAEIKEAQEEGVVFHFLSAPVNIKQKGSRLEVVCQCMELGAPDASGRRRPEPVKGSEFTLETDALISAIGQKPDFNFLPDNYTNKGWVINHPTTGQLNAEPKVFAIGDCVTGPDLVVTAVAQGREVSSAIDQFLQGQVVTGETKPFSSVSGSFQDLPNEMFERIERHPRMTIPMPDALHRKQNFDDIEGTPDTSTMQQEASRCLTCGCDVVDTCKLKTYSQQYEADQQRFKGDRRSFEKDRSKAGIIMEIDKCINCSACVRICDEQKKFHVFNQVGRGFPMRIKPEFERPLSQTMCDACGLCVEVCPTAGVRSEQKHE